MIPERPDGSAPPSDHGRPAAAFTWPVRVYWEDTDAGGIVFYANYLRFFERARTEWLRERGFGQRQLQLDHGGQFVVVEAHLRYHRSARLDDELLLTAAPSRIGAAGLTIQQGAWLGAVDSGELLCEAVIRLGWLSSADMRPARMPANLAAALE
jgi:acyl-CoA thioester hydrolase